MNLCHADNDVDTVKQLCHVTDSDSTVVSRSDNEVHIFGRVFMYELVHLHVGE